jgi:hypothetical protein
MLFEARYASRLAGLSDQEAQRLSDDDRAQQRRQREQLRTQLEQRVREAWAVRRDDIARAMETVARPRVKARMTDLNTADAPGENETEKTRWQSPHPLAGLANTLNPTSVAGADERSGRSGPGTASPSPARTARPGTEMPTLKSLAYWIEMGSSFIPGS